MALTMRMRRRHEEAPTRIAAEIRGDVSGQLAVGDHIVQVSAAHGAVVNVAAPEQAPTIRPRATPAAILPRPLTTLLGRERELQELRDAVRDGLAAELHGPAGIGKTALLRALCHDDVATQVEHGVVFLRVAGQTTEDAGQQLFEALYESDVPVKPTPVELCRHLRDRRALVVLDDVRWERDDLAELMDWAPTSAFVLAGERRCAWGDCSSQQLGGLAPDAALALLERALGRPLAGDERTRAAELCSRLERRPLAIVQAAGLARDGELPLATPSPESDLRERLDPSEQRVLATLEALRPAAVHADDVAAIARVPDAPAVLERLAAAGAAQANSPRWNVVLREPVDAAPDAELAARAAARLAAGAERPSVDAAPLLAALAACARAQRWSDVTAAVRAADVRLTLQGSWGAWRIALEHARTAAHQAGDRGTEAWTLHQLGTRAGCRGELDVARPLLVQALELRQRLGDAAGAAVTAHNLAVFDGRGGGTSSPRSPRPRLPLGVMIAVVLGLLVAGGVATALMSSGRDASSPPPAAAPAGQSRPTAPAQQPPAAAQPSPQPEEAPSPGETDGVTDGDTGKPTEPSEGTRDVTTEEPPPVERTKETTEEPARGTTEEPARETTAGTGESTGDESVDYGGVVGDNSGADSVIR